MYRVMGKRSLTPSYFFKYFLENDEFHTEETMKYREQILSKIASMDGWKDAFISHLIREFDELAEQKYFQQFDEKNPTNLEDMDFEDVHNTIRKAALTWEKLIAALKGNLRSQRPSVKGKLVGDRERKFMPRHLYLITSVISHPRSRMKSNLFSEQLESTYHNLESKAVRRSLVSVSNVQQLQEDVSPLETTGEGR